VPTLLQTLDCLVEPPGVEVDLAEAPEGAGVTDAVTGPRQYLGVEVLRELGLTEAERDVGLDEPVDLVDALSPRRQVVLVCSEPAGELAQELQRGYAVAALDPADVDGRAARKRELALASPLSQRIACGGSRLCYRRSVADVPPQATVYAVLCPHCGKSFRDELLTGPAERYHGFKCPHCRLFVPFERVAEQDAVEPVS
jgi:hypothetical protein